MTTGKTKVASVAQPPAVEEPGELFRTSPEAQIYNSIHRAITERRLLPGSRLVEEQLAEVFGVSRMRIRAVLQALARDRVVSLNKNRGACVATPTVTEAREVFAARRLVEVALAREVVRSIDAKGLKQFKAHIKKEIHAEKSHDRTLELTVSHQFHTLLAEVAGNSVIVDFLKELMARSALITAIYERPDVKVCSNFAHSHLINLIEKRDEQGVADAMLAHLDEIESYLSLTEKEEAAVDLRSIFTKI